MIINDEKKGLPNWRPFFVGDVGLCKELCIANLLDSQVLNQPENRNIAFGELVVSMMLNGLGFTAIMRHMFPWFHADKPLDKLIRSSIGSEHINDSVLGRVLEKLFGLDVSEVYFITGCQAVNVLKLPCKGLNLNSTSLHVDGRYNSESEVDDEDMPCIKICRGYSRDHRPDLSQATLLKEVESLGKLDRKAFRCETGALRAFNEWQLRSTYGQVEPVITVKSFFTDMKRNPSQNPKARWVFLLSGY